MLLFLAIAAGLVAAWLIVSAVRPLVERGVVSADDWRRLEDESMELLARRDRLVEELRDIELEAALNKLDPRDLAELRARYEAEAVSLVRALDERVEVYQDRIAADVDAASRRRRPAAAAETAQPEPKTEPQPEPKAPVKPAPAPAAKARPAAAAADAAGCVACGAALEPEARFCDGCGAAQGAACAGCGQPNRPGARYCKGCGTALAVEESA